MPDNSLVILTHKVRLYPHHLTDWFNSGRLTEDVFIKKFIPALRALYFKDRESHELNCLSVHARRGDVADPEDPCYHSHSHMLWPIEHYEENIISFRKQFPDIPIKVFSEKEHSEDLDVLEKYDNLKIFRGDGDSLASDINTMVNSRYFLPSNSNLSYCISYISKGKIILSKERPLKYFHREHIWGGVIE